MRPRSTLASLLCLLAGTALAQTARVQVIHNSADAAASAVDVYLNGALLLDDFAFRTATPFVDAPAGVPIEVAIAPSTSTSVADAIFSQDFTLDDGGTYVVVADGIVSPTGYSPATPFTLEVYPAGREVAAGGASNTDVLVHHGSTDAPTVDIYESAVVNSTIVDDASYPQFAGYLELPTTDFVLQVRDQTGTAIVAAYQAPLATLGLGGAALVAVASGFLTPALNSDGPAFGIFVALASGGPLVELPAAPLPAARVQVIHNSADAAAAAVDVYLDGSLLLDDFAFRTATPFVDAPADVPIEIAIAPSTSMSVADAIFLQDFTLDDGGTYVIVADGIVSPSGYTPATAFTLEVYPAGREVAAGGATNTDVLVHHGSTDAPTVDIYESAVVNTTIVDNAAYPAFAGYLELPTTDFVLQVRDEFNSSIVTAYSAPLETLGLGGAALVAVASGFLDPSVNSDGPAFGIFVALASGGPLVALPAAEIPTARVQVIHNAADLAASEVDVWLNNTLLLDDFAFRTASPFVDAQAGVPFDVSVALPTSTDTVAALARFTYTLAAGETYVLVANGIVSPSGYSPVQPFDIYVQAGARETSAIASNVDVLVFHGSTDAPTVDVVETAIPAGTIVDDISYGEFDGYLELPEADYVLQIQNMGMPVASYQAPLATLGLAGNALTVLASGFLSPANNSNGPGFGLWAALASGGPLVELPLSTGIGEAMSSNSLRVMPNPADDVLYVELDAVAQERTSLSLLDRSGRLVRSFDARLWSGEQRITLDLSGIAQGAYLLRATTTNGTAAVPVQKR